VSPYWHVIHPNLANQHLSERARLFGEEPLEAAELIETATQRGDPFVLEPDAGNVPGSPPLQGG
jgi:hypothetical protein